jgi:hypothetical protein
LFRELRYSFFDFNGVQRGKPSSDNFVLQAAPDEGPTSFVSQGY